MGNFGSGLREHLLHFLNELIASLSFLICGFRLAKLSCLQVLQSAMQAERLALLL